MCGYCSYMKFKNTKHTYLLLMSVLFVILSLFLYPKLVLQPADAFKPQITYSKKGKYIYKDRKFQVRFLGSQINKKQFLVRSIGWSFSRPKDQKTCGTNFIVKTKKGKLLWETPDSARFCPLDGNWRKRRISDFKLPAFSKPFILPLQTLKVYVREDQYIIKDRIIGPATVRWPKQ